MDNSQSSEPLKMLQLRRLQEKFQINPTIVLSVLQLSVKLASS
jgi:hypothetical protein